MSEKDLLDMLKIDLGICVTGETQQGARIEKALKNYIQLAESAITCEGIQLDTYDNHEDAMLVMMYAGYLYRKREAGARYMPKQLRYMLNNRLFSQKAREDAE